MTAFVLAGDATLRDIGTAAKWGVVTGRTGGDTIDTNGFKVTMDQDSRYGKSGATSTTWGSMTINAAKGGEIHFDGRYVRLIPFTNGSSGTTITVGNLVTCGGATGRVIGLCATQKDFPATTGVATGWLKVTAWNGVPFPTSGTFTQAGYTFTISGADITGYIEINGDDASSIIANRLGTVRITGAWYSLGVTTGVAGQTVNGQINGSNTHLPGVFIEKTAGLKDYEFYPNCTPALAVGTDVVRGKVVSIGAMGTVTIGIGTGAYTPPAGLEVVIPNIIFHCNTTASRIVNVLPNATIATRYDFTCTGGGVLEIDKACMNWYLSVSQAYSCNVSNSCFTDGILLSEVAAPMTFTNVGVGNKATTALLMSPLTMSYCYAGGTFTDCVWQRVSMAASGAHTVALNDISGFTFVRNTIRCNTPRKNATTYALNGLRVKDCTWTSPTIIQGAMYFATCDGITVTDTTYCEMAVGTTPVTYAGYVWNVTGSTTNCKFDGLTLPVTDNHPYTALLIGSAGCSNIKLRNIGTKALPVSLGSANQCGLIYTIGTNCSNIKVQRVYTSSPRTGAMTGDNSCKNITEEHVFTSYADATSVMACLNMKRKGYGGAGSVTAQESVYGTHWFDRFTNNMVSHIVLRMNEPTVDTASQVTLTGGANFTSAGGLYMPVIGQSATFEMPEYALGHTGFAAVAATMSGGTVTNYAYEYAIDKNNGAGWSTMTAAGYTGVTLGNYLSIETGIDASKGFKLRIKITTIVTNTTAITAFVVSATTSDVAQGYQYPLDTATVALDGLVAGSRVKATKVSDGTVLFNGLESGGAISFQTEYLGAINLEARKASSAPFYQAYVTQVTSISGSTVSATALQQLDE